MIYFPVKSLPNSAIPSGFNTYKIRKNNPLHFQHLQNSSDLFILKPLKPPLESTLTRPLSLTPLESTLTKNRGRGVVLVPLTKNSLNFASLLFTPSVSREGATLVYPESRSQGASLFATLCKERNASPVFPIVCALFAKTTRVYPNYSLPRRLSPRGQLGTRTSAPAANTQAASIRHLKFLRFRLRYAHTSQFGCRSNS